MKWMKIIKIIVFEINEKDNNDDNFSFKQMIV